MESEKAAKYCHEKVDEIRLHELPASYDQLGYDTNSTRELRQREAMYDCAALVLEAISRVEKLLRQMQR